MSGTINYRRAIAGNVTGFVNLNYTGQRGGGQDTVTVATPYIPLSDYDIFGLRAGVDIDKVRIALFVRNLTDTEFQTLKFYQANGAPYSARYNRPRTIGITGSYRW
jgi:outer membrane cobalamin receptor